MRTLRMNLRALSVSGFSSILLLTIVGLDPSVSIAQQVAKTAVTDQQSSPYDPVAANMTAAAVLAEIANSGLPERGTHNAAVSIIFFDDLECPYSAAMYRTLFDEVMRDYSEEVKVIIRPVANSSIHPWASRAAINASCLAAQNPDAYWDFADYVHKHQDEVGGDSKTTLNKLALDIAGKRSLDDGALRQCIAAQADTVVQRSHEYVKSLKVTGVPTLFVNTERVESAVSAEQVREAIERAKRDLKDSKSTHGSLSSTKPRNEARVSGVQKTAKENPR